MQHRLDVPLAAIRDPLASYETIEVLTKHGVLEGEVLRRHQIMSNISYTVAFQAPVSDESHEARVPANFLQRYYPPGSDVEVYRGPSLGWVPATVHKPVETGTGTIVIAPTWRLGAFAETGSTVRFKKRPFAPPWRTLPLVTGAPEARPKDWSTASDSPPEEVPLHLVRRKPCAQASQRMSRTDWAAFSSAKAVRKVTKSLRLFGLRSWTSGRDRDTQDDHADESSTEDEFFV